MHQLLYEQLFLELLICAGIALFSLIIGARGLLTKRPFFIASRWIFIVLTACLFPQIVSTIYLSKFMGSGFVIIQICWILLILMFLYAFFMVKESYVVFGATEISLREPIRQVLKEMNMGPAETKLNLSARGWMGVGRISIKDRKDSQLLKETVHGLKIYSKVPGIEINKVIFIFFITLAALMVSVLLFFMHFLKH